MYVSRETMSFLSLVQRVLSGNSQDDEIASDFVSKKEQPVSRETVDATSRIADHSSNTGNLAEPRNPTNSPSVELHVNRGAVAKPTNTPHDW